MISYDAQDRKSDSMNQKSVSCLKAKLVASVKAKKILLSQSQPRFCITMHRHDFKPLLVDSWKLRLENIPEHIRVKLIVVLSRVEYLKNGR